MGKNKGTVKIIPLGGMREIGKNITVIEYNDEILVVDCGVAFPEDEMLGIDLVIPDVSYLKANVEKVKGIILTHGHEDHIGAIPYVLREVNVPVYGTRLTLALLKNKLVEHGMLDTTDLKVVKQGENVQFGKMSVDFIRSTHSIPDSVALAIHTPVGVIVHTSDFKIDFTPLDMEPMDLNKLAELGSKGVLLLMCDSTNVEREGYTLSEKIVGEAFEEIFLEATGRILVATFASNVQRIQQVINAAARLGRKLAICGRSIENVFQTAMQEGYLNVPDGMLIDIDKIGRYKSEELVILTTGSQGEPMSALARMAASDHKKVEIVPGDLIIISATPIPGNEKLVYKVINELFNKGAEVIYEKLADVHVSGHACKEELKLVHKLVKPKYFMPVHGEYRHLKQHANLAAELGMKPENIFLMDIGEVLELTSRTAKKNGSVTSGRILVDGLGVGDVGNVVLRDRKLLSQDGLLVVVVTADKETGQIIAGPDLISRGFVYVRESEELMEEAREVAKNALLACSEKKKNDWALKKNVLKNALKDFMYEKTKRRPMILPIVMEI
ncbi:MAG: ribonuclease J [Eubacteriales bacterium]|nr:ribonuclease J [Eubacteriales bacterium]